MHHPVYYSAGSKRGQDIAASLRATFYAPEYVRRTGLARHWILRLPELSGTWVKDLWRIWRLRPSIVILEYSGGLVPLLAVWAVAQLRGCSYGLDCHTAAYVSGSHVTWGRRRVEDFIRKRARVVILHNRKSLAFERSDPGRAVLVESPVPALAGAPRNRARPGEPHRVVFVTKFHSDEPVEKMLEACRHLGEGWACFFSGNASKWPVRLDLSGLTNVTLTGFLSDRDYRDLLVDSAVVVVLTERDHTLVYGGREALALGKPLVVSDNDVCREYFGGGAIFTRNDPALIARAIREAYDRRGELSQRSEALRAALAERYEEQIVHLRRMLADACR